MEKHEPLRTYKIPHAAVLLDCSVRHIERLIAEGRLKVRRFGPRMRRIMHDDLVRFLAGDDVGA